MSTEKTGGRRRGEVSRQERKEEGGQGKKSTFSLLPSFPPSPFSLGAAAVAKSPTQKEEERRRGRKKEGKKLWAEWGGGGGGGEKEGGRGGGETHFFADLSPPLPLLTLEIFALDPLPLSPPPLPLFLPLLSFT